MKAGLADRVGTLRQALADLSITLAPKPTPRGRAARPTESRKEAYMQTADPTIDPGAEEPVSPAPEAATVRDTTTPATAIDPAQIEQRLRGEYAELAAVAAQAARLGIKVDTADAMAKGVRADALRRSVLDELAARSDATDIVATAPAAARLAESPIVKRAKEAAGKGTPA